MNPLVEMLAVQSSLMQQQHHLTLSILDSMNRQGDSSARVADIVQDSAVHLKKLNRKIATTQEKATEFAEAYGKDMEVCCDIAGLDMIVADLDTIVSVWIR